MPDNNTTTDDAQARQQPPEPNPDLRSLDRLVGTWEVPDPSGAGAINGRSTFEWMEGSFFLIHRPDFVDGDGRQIKGIEVIGHERPFGAEPSEDIKTRFYGNTGETLDYVWEMEGDTFRIWFGERGSPTYYEGTFSADGDTFSADGDTFSGVWHYPGGGSYEATATRFE